MAKDGNVPDVSDTDAVALTPPVLPQTAANQR